MTQPAAPAEAYDPTRLQHLGTRHQKLRHDLDALRPELAEEIRAADAAGMAQVDIVRATGYTRDQVRQICLPPQQRRSRRHTGERSPDPARTEPADQNS